MGSMTGAQSQAGAQALADAQAQAQAAEAERKRLADALAAQQKPVDSDMSQQIVNGLLGYDKDWRGGGRLAQFGNTSGGA
jgi:hypothetical protein